MTTAATPSASVPAMASRGRSGAIRADPAKEAGGEREAGGGRKVGILYSSFS